MVELTLTTERRKELADLLGDEQRLKAEYPKLADYLEMAPELPGTGNAQMDSEFDLRLVHHITANDSFSVNPYWDIVSPLVFECDHRRVVNGGRTNGSGRLAYAAMMLQATYAYAIPSPETLDWVIGVCDDRPILELGAGRGYWAAQLARLGAAIDAYDIEPPGIKQNASFPVAPGQRDTWHDVGDLKDLSWRGASQSNGVLLLCWPPGWGDVMASWALAEFEKAGGDSLIYVGELQGGKTGDDAFFNALTSKWKLESHDSQYVTWWNLKDVAQSWVRN